MMNQANEVVMAPKIDSKEAAHVVPKKTYWHLYSLQTLQSEKLAVIVNKVLKKEYVLIK